MVPGCGVQGMQGAPQAFMFPRELSNQCPCSLFLFRQLATGKDMGRTAAEVGTREDGSLECSPGSTPHGRNACYDDEVTEVPTSRLLTPRVAWRAGMRCSDTSSRVNVAVREPRREFHA